MPEMDLTRWEKMLKQYIRDKRPKEYRKLLRKAGNLLRKNVRRATAKDEGELRKSYRVKVKPRESSVDVYTNKFYAKMVEEGHAIVKYDRSNGRRIKRTLGFVPGKFYFRKGLEKTEGELQELLKEFLKDMGRELGLDVTG